MTIYVGNLNYQVREEELSQLFSEYGEVTSVKIVKDSETGRPRGFAFIEMADESSANDAIEALNEAEFHQRPLVVNMARPKGANTDRPRSFSKGNGGGGFNRGGGGNNRGGGNRY